MTKEIVVEIKLVLGRTDDLSAVRIKRKLDAMFAHGGAISQVLTADKFQVEDAQLVVDVSELRLRDDDDTCDECRAWIPLPSMAGDDSIVNHYHDESCSLFGGALCGLGPETP